MKRIFFLLSVICALSLFSLSVFAEEGDMPEGYGELIGDLGDDISERLPDGIFSDDADEVGESVSNMSESGFWFSVTEEILKETLASSAQLFMKLCGLIVLSAIFSAVSRSLSSDSMSSAVRFCSVSAIFASMIYIQTEHLRSVEQFFGRLLAMMGAMIPITGTVWAMGGNVSTATAGTSALYVFLSVCEGIFGKSIVPVCCVFTALALCNSLAPDMGLSGLTATLKRIYTFFLGFIMTVLISSLSSQTALSAAADSTGARAAKLLSANVIPIVGASVGDTLRTVATSVGYLKSIIGIGGICFILLLLLPLLAELLLTRLAFSLASGVGELMGCDTEKRFLSELGGVYGIMIAVVAMSSVMFIFALTIFLKTVVALM